MDLSTYFDFIPDELIILIFTYTRSNINIGSRLNNLYNKFINNIKKGVTNPDDVFDSTTNVYDTKESLLFFIKIIKKCTTYDVDCYLQLNAENTFFDRIVPDNSNYEENVTKFIEKNISKNEKLSESMSKITMGIDKFYLWEDSYNGSDTKFLILKNKENFIYVDVTYVTALGTGWIVMKTEKNWKKFYTEILNETLRNSLILNNRYII